jgi:hypothetical protein
VDNENINPTPTKRQRTVTSTFIRSTLKDGGTLTPMPANLSLSGLFNILKVS